MSLESDPELVDALDGLINAVRYCEDRDLGYGREISELYQQVGSEAPDGDWDEFDNHHSNEEIQENMRERMDVAIDLLEDHPYIISIWSSPIGGELAARFNQVNPDTETLEVMLGLEEYATTLVDGSEREMIDSEDLVVNRTWDVEQEYHALDKEGEEVPFEVWADGFEWTTGSWQQTVEDFLNDAGWERV